MSRRRGRVGLLSVAAALLMAACGGGEEASDEKQVKETITTYFSSFAEGDGATACEQLSGAGQRELTQAIVSRLPEVNAIRCDEVVSELSGTIGPDEEATLRAVSVEAVQVRGNTATAQITGAAVEPTLIKADGRWLIDSGFAGR